MFHPSLHLLAFVCDYLPTIEDLRVAVLLWVGPSAFLKGHCIEFKYYADGIHSGLTPPG